MSFVTSSYHNDEPMRFGEFEVGDLVFVKMRGYSPWPSKITQVQTTFNEQGKSNINYKVLFFGTHQWALVKSSALFHYEQHAGQIVKKYGANLNFYEALKELERELLAKKEYLKDFKIGSCSSISSYPSDGSLDLLSQFNEVESETSQAPVCESNWKNVPYKITDVEKVRFSHSTELLIVVSLQFDEDKIKQECAKIEEERRMRNCYVKLERLPPLF